jgi:2-octaprenyl-6-methoxyphenol hydroxylase
MPPRRRASAGAHAAPESSVTHVFDIVIAGGGMAGATLALALRDAGLTVALVETADMGRVAARAPDGAPACGYDDRGIALSVASRRVLEHIGVWERVLAFATAIRAVHVSEAGCFGCVRLAAADLGAETLGHVVIARALGTVLWEAVRAAPWVTPLSPDSVRSAAPGADGITVTCAGAGELSCRLLVVADGAESALRAQLGIDATHTDYGQTAIVCNVTMGLPHDGTAYERFSPHGPLALLPLDGARMVAVNCVATADASGWFALSDAGYCARLDDRFGGRLGGFRSCGARRAYPLARVVAGRQVADRAVLLGGAALTLHPNGAQGFNVALRDVAALAEVLHGGADPGAPAPLQTFARERAADRERVMQFSHGLARVFTSPNPFLAGVRRVGLLLTELAPPLKRELMLFGAGLHGRQPACVRSVA